MRKRSLATVFALLMTMSRLKVNQEPETLCACPTWKTLADADALAGIWIGNRIVRITLAPSCGIQISN